MAIPLWKNYRLVSDSFQCDCRLNRLAASVIRPIKAEWPRLDPFFDYPPEIRKVIYTTNAIEAVNYGLRRLTKHRGAFPSDEALIKLLYLALRNISKRRTLPIRDWKAALNRFTIQFEDRMPQR